MIRRAEHSADKRFTIISRSLAQNKSLSFQARGFLVFVLSKPAKWEASDANLQKDGAVGKKALASILVELKKAGYLRRTQERKRDGTIHYVTEIFEEPLVSADSTVTPKGTTATVTPFPPTVKGTTATVTPFPPTVKGTTATVTPFPPTVKGTTDNKSTGAGAGSSVDLTDLRERGTKKKTGYKTKEPEVPLDTPYHGERFIDTLNRFERHKVEIKSKLTMESRQELYRILSQCEDEDIAIEALLLSIRNGWKGVFPERINGNGYHDPKPAQRVQTIRERMGLDG